jgi:soluble cytochrome b562
MRSIHISAALLLIAAMTLAGAKKDESLEELKARAESAKLSDQPALFARIARMEVDEADRHYTAGDVAAGKKAVQEVVQYAQRAGEAARKSGKHQKPTEIELRHIARRLDDLRKTLNFDDRPEVEAAVRQVEQIRQHLLDHMFGLKAQERKP